jgi:hypothetical protein
MISSKKDWKWKGRYEMDGEVGENIVEDEGLLRQGRHIKDRNNGKSCMYTQVLQAFVLRVLFAWF